MRLILISFGLFCSFFDGLNAEKEHVHIRLKIPKMINRHTHFETKYVHVFHPVPVPPPPPLPPHIPPHTLGKSRGFGLRNDPLPPNALNEINTTSHRVIPTYSSYLGDDMYNLNRRPKGLSSEERYSLEDHSKYGDFSDEDITNMDFKSSMTSYPDKSRYSSKFKTSNLYITTDRPNIPEEYNHSFIKSEAHVNGIPKITNLEKFKTSYWKSSGKGYNQRVPLSMLDRSESRRSQVAIMPRRDKFKQVPFFIKVLQ